MTCHRSIEAAALAVFLCAGALPTLSVAQAGSAQGWDVIRNSDFAPPPLHHAPGPSSATPLSSQHQTTSILQPVTEAAPEAYPQLAAQYLESARWNERRGETDAMLSNLRSAAQFDSAGAHFELARMLIEGEVIPRDLDQASVHLHAASGLGFPEAQRVLGRMILRGDFGEPDYQRGVDLMAAAAATSVRARRELGMWFAGLIDGVPRDTDFGFGLIRQAAEVGDDISAKLLIEHAPEQMQQEFVAGEPQRLAAAHPVEGEKSQQLSPSQLFDYANKIMLQPQSKRQLQDEALAYAVFKLAYEQGHEPSGRELNYLDGIRVLMERRQKDWLEEYMDRAVRIMFGMTL